MSKGIDLRAKKKCKHGDPFWDCTICKHHYHKDGAVVMNYAGVIVSGYLCPDCDIYFLNPELYTYECPSCLKKWTWDPAAVNFNFSPGRRGRRGM